MDIWKNEFFRREAIHSINTKNHVKYKYIERSLGFNYDEELDVKASILGTT